MIATTSMEEEKKKSEKMVEANDDLRTVESLRGRLLAERQASRVANEEAEQLGNKLIELENQLKQETKMRKKADKKLNFLKKKLESLKMLPILEESEQSSTSSSDSCSHSCRSSTTTTSTSISGPKDSSEESESKPQMICNVSSDSTTSNQSHQNSSFQEKSSSISQDSITSSTSMKSSMEENQSEDEDYVDNTLALVPVSFPEKSQKNTSEMKIMSASSVGEVLDALRHAREKIQRSMESRRHMMIRVGPC
ncbi:hypothetical protein EZV62_016918 [Acer yangbiense]|uniref:Uncharacterized protein n=1 Tax=Acer yangbiense TaxID=1000413 RepID=A0A5C7HQJ2_9ROSI|nr:hypothetical protein EZV62_016918 [Acer yangbiense]